LKKSDPHNWFKLENLEPRILLSADTALAASAIDLPKETESGLDLGLLPLDEVALGDEDRLKDNPYQNQSTYDPSLALDDIFAGLAEDNLTDLSEDELVHEIESGHDEAHGFEDEYEDEYEDDDEDDNFSFEESVITSHQQDRIVPGLQALSRVGSVLENFAEFATRLTLSSDGTVRELAGFEEIRDTRLAISVYDHFNDALDPPGAQGMLQTIERFPLIYSDLDIAVSRLTGGITPDDGVLPNVLKFDATRRGEVHAVNPTDIAHQNIDKKQFVNRVPVDWEFDNSVTDLPAVTAGTNGKFKHRTPADAGRLHLPSNDQQQTTSDFEPIDAPHVLNHLELAPVIAEAIRRWSVSNLIADPGAVLDAVNFRIVDLPGGMLGHTRGTTVLIDPTAAGYGWFIDGSPADDTEFEPTPNPAALVATTGSPALGRMDLLTVVSHELGHVLGFEHAAVQAAAAREMMAADLVAGRRMLLAAAEYSVTGSAPPVEGALLAAQVTTQREIAFGQSLSGALEDPADEQLFDLEITANELDQPFSVVVDGEGTLRPRLEFLAPSGTVLATGRTNVFDTVIRDFVAEPVANGGEGPGTYQLLVTATTNALGTFEIGVSDLPLETPVPISFSSFLPGYLDHTGDEDLFTFAAQAGDEVTLNVLGSGFTPDLLLVGPAGFTAGTGDSDGLVTATLPADAQYIAVVRDGGAAGLGNGPYLLSLSQPRPAAAPIDFGQRAAGRVDVPGDRATFHLNVAAEQVGRPVSILVSQVTDVDGPDIGFDTRLRLIAPDGTTQLEAVATGRGDLVAVEIDDFVLPSAGTHTIEVSDDGDDHTGSFTVVVNDQPVEPVNALPGFNTIVSGAIDPAGDVDEYAFIGTAGQIVTVQRLAGIADMTLLDPDGAVVAGSGPSDSLLELVTLPTDGEYRLRFEPNGGTVHAKLDDTGDYRFAVWTPDRDPAPVPIGFGQNQPGRLTTRGDIIRYGLEVLPAHVGEPVSIVVSQVTEIGGPDIGFDTRLRLVAQDGTTELATVSTVRGDLFAIEIDDLVLPAAGAYILQVSDDNDDHTGSFTVGVSGQPIETPNPLPAFNQPITGAMNFISDVDEFFFAGTAGQIVTIQRLTGSVDLTLFGPDGSVVAGSGTADSRFNLVTLPDDGDYLLRLEPSGGTVSGDLDDTGHYSFAVWTPARDPVPLPVDFGRTQPGRLLVPGDIANYSLEVAAQHVGRPVSIVLSQVTGVDGPDVGIDSRLRLFAPDGTTQLATVSTDRGDLRAIEIDDFVLPGAGTYTIQVSDDNDDHTGRFTVGISDQPTETPAAVPIGSKTEGILAPHGDVDEFRVTSTTGDAISVFVSADQGLDSDLTVLRPDGTVLASASSGTNSSLSFTPAAGVHYTLRVEPGGGTVDAALDDGGIYLLEVSDALNPAAYRVDDGLPIALTAGEMHTGTIDSATDIDTYTFSGTRGATVRIATATGRDRNATLRAALRVVGPGNVELAQVTTVTEPDLKSLTLPEDGDYRVEVSGRSSDLGPYVIGLSDRPAEEASPTDVSAGDRLAGSLFPLADEDVYRFNYNSGDIVNLNFSSAESGKPLQVEIITPAGTVFTNTSGSSTGLTEATLPGPGDYLAVLTAGSPVVVDYFLDFTARPSGTPPAGAIARGAGWARQRACQSAGRAGRHRRRRAGHAGVAAVAGRTGRIR